jgi:drug/metabolite transporter (DMT)-like permease
MLVLGAALCWSISNILLRITASKLPPASGFDIALINYLVAAIFLILASWVVCRVKAQPFRLPPMQSLATFWLVAAAKGINTYSWILAVALISAASAATLEGLHVVFTVALLLALRVKAPTGSWIASLASSAILVVGVVLILGLPVAGSGLAAWTGIFLGIISAFSFSVFYVLWQRTGARSEMTGPRTLEMGILLLAATFCLFPIHLAVNALWWKAPLVPFGAMDGGDIGIQVACGLIGIGTTYYLINESLHYMKSHKLCSLLLGIGLSYSVPFTMILETLFLGLTPRFEQWLGAILFAAAFAAIFKDMREAVVKPEPAMTTELGRRNHAH